MFRTRSQALLPITVHHYALANSEPEPPEELLRRGRLATSHDTTWRNLDVARVILRQRSIASFELPDPPQSPTGRSRPRIAAEWGDAPGNDEIFSIADLDEFQNTELSDIFVHPPPKRTATEASLDDDEPSKRPRFNEGSLRDLIPPPHILPSLPTAPARKFRGLPYTKETPIPVPPHTLPIPPPSPYARRSWAIPLRGPLPWRRATRAAILDSSESRKQPHPPTPDSDEIVWSAAAIQAFWAFLLELRSRNQLGPLGMSFNVSPITASNSQLDYGGDSYMGAGQGQPMSVDGAPAPSTASSRIVYSAIPLHQVDHIKVYHDAMNSMELRNVLYAWSFLMKDEVKIRLLKGARFVLLDERSNGILIV
ncbi:hypothetical protein C8F01DRAFT_1153643 [Mycena amicta]|nr:hypothetical protein C8F01DRAFT_1153643 [Mycena amicta]